MVMAIARHFFQHGENSSGIPANIEDVLQAEALVALEDPLGGEEDPLGGDVTPRNLSLEELSDDLPVPAGQQAALPASLHTHAVPLGGDLTTSTCLPEGPSEYGPALAQQEADEVLSEDEVSQTLCIPVEPFADLLAPEYWDSAAPEEDFFGCTQATQSTEEFAEDILGSSARLPVDLSQQTLSSIQPSWADGSDSEEDFGGGVRCVRCFHTLGTANNPCYAEIDCCHHYMCTDCGDAWAGKHKTCPECGKSFTQMWCVNAATDCAIPHELREPVQMFRFPTRR